MPDVSEVTPPAARVAAKSTGWTTRLRWKVQLAALVLLNPFGLAGLTGICVPVLNCHACPAAWTTCPVGAIGGLLAIGMIPWIALGAFGFVGALFGRLTCGWICPVGFFQDLLAKIRLPRWHPPRWTRWIKYGVLLGTVFLAPIFIGTDTRLFFCRICPAGTATGSGWYWLAYDHPIALTRIVFLLGFLALMLFVRRGFCNIICPIGAGLSVFNRISLFTIKFMPRWCSKCLKCLRGCPSEQGPAEDPRSPECIYCLDCFKCPALKANFSADDKAPIAEE